jgi:hypothetical protein
MRCITEEQYVNFCENGSDLRFFFIRILLMLGMSDVTCIAEETRIDVSSFSVLLRTEKSPTA